jgi:hypothetical protein
VLVSSLHRPAAEDKALAKRLLQYQIEGNPAVRTAYSIRYCLLRSNCGRSKGPTSGGRVKKEVTAIGPWMDMIRQAALAGFIALDELSVFRELPDDWRPEKKISLDVLGLDNNRPILDYIAKHWDRVTIALEPDVFERLTHSNEWWWWDNLAPYISESAPLRADFLAYCSREQKVLSSRAIEALAREAPESHLLRAHCLRCLNEAPQDINFSNFEQRRCELVVGRILGRQFADETAVHDQLENRIMFRPSAGIVALSIAWRDSSALATEYKKLNASDGQGGHYLWPDAAYLVSTLGLRDEFRRFLVHFVENCTDYLWIFLPFCIEPIVARIKSEDGLASNLIDHVKSSHSGSEKASLPKLLA